MLSMQSQWQWWCCDDLYYNGSAGAVMEVAVAALQWGHCDRISDTKIFSSTLKNSGPMLKKSCPTLSKRKPKPNPKKKFNFNEFKSSCVCSLCHSWFEVHSTYNTLMGTIEFW